MRTLAISAIKNERDVVELFVRHNLRFVDAIVVMDNGSTDGTRAILARLVKEGLPLAVFDEPAPAYRQSEWMTHMYRNSIRFFDVDFCLPLDADEFIAVENRDRFQDAISRIPKRKCGLAPWKTYVWQPGANGEDPLRAMRQRRAEEQPVYDKVIIPVDRSAAHKLVIAQGSHSLRRRNGRKFRQVRVDGVSIAHFPVRSPDQLKNKILTGWLAYLARDGAKAGQENRQGYHWQAIYDRIVEGALSHDEVSRISFNYAQDRDLTAPIPEGALIEDPLETDAESRYHNEVASDPLVAITRVAEAALRTPPDSTSAEQPTAESQKGLRRFWRRVHDRVASRIWSAEMHSELLYLDYPPFRFLYDRLEPRSVLDLGCGSGGHVKALQRWGAGDICAVDDFEPSDKLHCPEAFVQHNLEESLDLRREFDLVINTQVIEHIDAGREDIVLDSIERHSRNWILFSGADETQPGIGHINCRPISHWLEAWDKRGWKPDVFASLAFRSLSTFSWLRRNPLVLTRQGNDIPGSSFLTEDLLAIGSVPYPGSASRPPCTSTRCAPRCRMHRLRGF